MDKSTETLTCINCGRAETEVPLLAMRFAGHASWICSQCMPVLIHKPHLMAEKLPGSEKIEPADHAH
ncbi:MAG: hypothetical protein GY943_29870 [Chloroflexi bacterium]|nr:hypothetical protein [Chloroflexota bacterium]